jgi:hypothetical protein
MRRTLGWVAAITAVFVAIALLYYWVRKSTPEAQSPQGPPAEVAPAPAVGAEPRILYPVPSAESPPKKPLPALADSDAALEHELRALTGGKSLAEIVLFPDLVRRVVATVDNLPRKAAPQRLLPIRNIPGQILVSVGADGAELKPQNSARYASYVRVAETVDTAQLVALYVRFYPLFQRAYQDLGYPNAYFNDRVVVVIDDLLAAPEIHGPLRLVQPKVMYEFADPELETRSAGQKILIRMGIENAARIKAKLREIRKALVALAIDRPS